MSEFFDAIVVGAGSSGGVVAARLSEDDGRSVLLLEAGPDFPEEHEFPPGFVGGGAQFHTQFAAELDWNYWSEPLAGGRRIRLPRGRMVGGSSMTNGCMCLRAAPADLERWQAAGARDWGWEEVLPAYEAVEREVPIKRYPREAWQPVQAALYDAFLELGYRECADMNAPDAWYGTVGPTPINRLNEVRQGTLVTYIRKARPRPNFQVRGGALVDRVLLDGTRATGVRYRDDSGRPHEVRADLVVLSAGAYGTPAILLRSGIGPPERLRALGIEPVLDLPVGATLLDHGACYVYLHAPELAEMRAPSAAVFARAPDNEWLMVAAVVDEAAGTCGIPLVTTGDNRAGPVELTSADPAAPPRIVHGYDTTGFEAGWEVLQAVLATRPFAGVENLDDGRSLADLLAARVTTCFHAAGTCAIGAVVDDDLRVLGIEALRVADASIFPSEVSNNPNLTCYMIGERLAAKLRGVALPTKTGAHAPVSAAPHPG